jgi:HSP20 family protein
MAETAITPTKPGGAPLQAWDPMAMLSELQADLERFWDRGWGAWPLWRWPANGGATTWAPKMDVFEKDGQLTLRAELPGLTKDDVELMLDHGDLVLRGKREQESEVQEADYYRSERHYGSFYRRLALGFEVKPEQVTARFKDGILEVTLPRPPAPGQPEPIRVPVS